MLEMLLGAQSQSPIVFACTVTAADLRSGYVGYDVSEGGAIDQEPIDGYTARKITTRDPDVAQNTFNMQWDGDASQPGTWDVYVNNSLVYSGAYIIKSGLYTYIWGAPSASSYVPLVDIYEMFPGNTYLIELVEVL